MNALLGEHVTAVMASYPNVAELVTTGKLRALATASAARIEPMPDVPTIAESGFKDFEADIWFGLVAPAKTPGEAISQLAAWFTAALKDPEVRRSLPRRGFFPSAPAELISPRSRTSNTTITAAPFATPTSKRSKIRPMSASHPNSRCASSRWRASPPCPRKRRTARARPSRSA